MKILLFLFGLPALLAIFPLVQHFGFNEKATTEAGVSAAKFIIIDEFYMFEGDSTRTKLIQHKSTNQCFLLKHAYYRRSGGAGTGEYLSPASCASTSTFIVVDKFYMFEGDNTKTMLIKNQTTNECFLLKHAFYRRSGGAGAGEYLSPASCSM